LKHARQFSQRFCQTGFLSTISMLSTGQTRAHVPHPLHFSSTAKDL